MEKGHGAEEKGMEEIREIAAETYQPGAIAGNHRGH